MIVKTSYHTHIVIIPAQDHSMLIFQFFVTTILLGMSGILLLNGWTFPKLRQAARRPMQHAPSIPSSHHLVSILIPARNEAAVIADTVRSLLAQDTPDLEVLVLDDHSNDGTGALALAAAAATADGDPRLRVLSGADLPAGWLGKNWACHQLAQSARGQLLIFTDADVRWAPGAVDALLAEFERTQADLLTIWPTQTTVTWGERLVVPLMALVVHAYLPILFVHHSPFALFAAANGQCIAFRRAAYDAVGGHTAVRDNVLEDVTLARLAKTRRLRLRMAEGNHLIGCRMYRAWTEVRDGYAKNILKGYGSAAGLIAATLFHWIVFLGPWIGLILGAAGVAVPGWPWWPLGLALWGIILRGLTALHSQQRIVDALFLPISVVLMTRITFQSLWWQWRYGGPVWKGRVVRNE